MMKFYGLLVIIFIVIISGCSRDSRKIVTVYSPHGKEMLLEFEKRFETVYPDIDIQWLDMGSQEVYDRIKTESQNPVCDIWWGAPATIFMRAEKDGLLEKFIPQWADRIPAASKSKNGMWFGTFLTPQVIAFNDKTLTNESAPNDWNDLILPEWKDKIIIRNPLASGTMRVIYSAAIANSIKNTGNDAEGFEWLKKLDANTSTYSADPTQMYIKLSGNDKAVTLWNMPDIILQKTLYNYPFGYNFPESGTVVLTDAIAVIKGSKNPEDAKKFYEFVTSGESLSLQAEKFFRIPARTDIPDDKLPEWIRTADYKALDLDWELISEKESQWMKTWDTEIKGKSK
ncbi:MAG TPA: extracellular solute-binding protein [Ignavibacteria bacterium]|nr:iron ABC transporter substrate-binding protein [Bacteroidota bacterium]HRI85497.1 extracellular solute-binding protein [Ignavibacteria bacterium]HRJ99281.1 extracellular solute-binding protein [Ignavibacteria bacterium]